MTKKIAPIDCPQQSKQSLRQFSQLLEDEGLLRILTHHQYAKNSLISMKNDWNNFLLFCLDKSVSPLPASVTAVRLYIEKQAKTKKLSTIKRYLVTIGLLHRCHSLQDPTNHRQVRFLVKSLQIEKKDDSQQAAAFTHNHLLALNNSFASSAILKDIRDVCIWNVMFETMLKRREAGDLDVRQLEYNNDGTLALSIELTTYQLSDDASGYLKKWLASSGIESGPIFRRLDRHGNVGDKPLDDSSLYRVFRRASDELGLANEQAFSGQSTRVGATRELAKQGYNLHDIQSFGRWVSPVMPAQYLGHKENSKKGKLLFKKIKSWD